MAFLAGSVAAEDRRDVYPARPLDFSLRFSHHHGSLDDNGVKIDNSVDRVSLVWRERFGERLQLGLAGGYAWLTQRNNAATAGRELNGYHAGFLFDLDLFRGRRVDAFLSGGWLYQNVSHDDGSEKVVIATREPSARLGAGLALDPNLRVYGGLRYGRIDGEQRRRGTVDETRTFTETRKTGGFAGLQLKLEGNGYVGLAIAAGSDRNVALYFGRRF